MVIGLTMLTSHVGCVRGMLVSIAHDCTETFVTIMLAHREFLKYGVDGGYSRCKSE
jgi:hypothetical protein